MSPLQPRPYQILVLDDDLAFRDLLATALMKSGYEVLMVARVSQALTLVQQIPFDLLIVDGVLPDGDGPLFIASAKVVNQSARVLFTSAEQHFFEDETMQRHLILELEVDGMLPKPLDLESFLVTVQRLLMLQPKANEAALWDLTEQGDVDATYNATPVLDPSAALQAEDLVESVKATESGTVLPKYVDSSTNATNPSMSLADLVQVSQLLEQKQSEYLPKMEQSLLDLQALLADAASWDQDSPGLRKAHALAHTLHGNAGSFGYNEVSQRCAEIEMLLARLLGGAPPKPAIHDELKRLHERALLSFSGHTAGHTAGSQGSMDVLPASMTKPVRARRKVLTNNEMDILPPVEKLLSIRLLIFGMEQDLFVRLLPEAARYNIEMDLATTAQEVDQLSQKCAFDMMLFRLTPPANLEADEALRTQVETFQIPMHIIPESVQIAQRIRHRQKRSPILFYGQELGLAKRILAAHVAGSCYIEQHELEATFLQSLIDLHAAVRRKTHILLLGNDREYGRTIEQIAGLKGIHVHCLPEPEAFLMLENASYIDLILIDATSLPIAGLDVCRLLFTSMRWRAVPYFFVTEEVTPHLCKAAWSVGVERVVAKDDTTALTRHMRNRLKQNTFWV